MQQLQRLILALSVVLLTGTPQSYGMNNTHQNYYDPIINKNEQLYEAVKEGDIDRVRELIENGANVNAHNKFKNTPLLYAAQNYGYEAIIELLIKNGASVNIENEVGATPLNRAALMDHPKIAQLLIRNGAHVNAQDKLEKTPLHHAANQGYPEVARLLIRNGACFDVQENEDNMTSYQIAQSLRHYKITTLCDQIISLQNNSFNDVITEDASRENKIYYAQAMIAHGYCNIARQITDQKLSSLSQQEYADIMFHTLLHSIHNNQYHHSNDHFIDWMQNNYANHDNTDRLVATAKENTHLPIVLNLCEQYKSHYQRLAAMNNTTFSDITLITQK